MLRPFLLLLCLMGCARPDAGPGVDPAPDPQESSPYDHLPVLSRQILEITTDPRARQCHGMMASPFPCFAGHTAAGQEILFAEGIDGYRYRSGQADRLRIEEIRYDFSVPEAPMDTSSIRYVLLPPKG